VSTPKFIQYVLKFIHAKFHAFFKMYTISCLEPLLLTSQADKHLSLDITIT